MVGTSICERSCRRYSPGYRLLLQLFYSLGIVDFAASEISGANYDPVSPHLTVTPP